MLDYITLSVKPTINIPSKLEGSTDVQCKDLAAPVFTNTDILLNSCTLVTVTEDYIARPDLISLAVYGNDKYADLICKINGISNPFELNTGMELVIPDLDSLLELIVKPRSSSIIEPNSKLSKITKSNQKLVSDKRTAVEQLVGESTFTIDKRNNIVIY